MHSLTATFKKANSQRPNLDIFNIRNSFAGWLYIFEFCSWRYFSEGGNTIFSRYLKRIYCEYPAIHWKNFLSCVKVGEQGKTKPFKTFKCFISYFPVLNLVSEYEKNVWHHKTNFLHPDW